MGTTATLALPYPELSEPADVPADIKQLADALDALGPGYVPVGAIMMWATAAAPTNWLLLNGAQVAATDYPKLALVLPPSGGLITLPNMVQRFPVGAGDVPEVPGAHALGGTGGAATVALTTGEIPAHNHPVTDPGHAHANGTLAVSNAGAIGTTAAGAHAHALSPISEIYHTGTQGTAVEVNPGTGMRRVQFITDTEPAHAHSVPAHGHGFGGAMSSAQAGVSTNNTGGGGAHENMPPFYVVNFIIRAK